ncbi:MAG: carboxylesterase family protein [Anaerolineales bacterium]|nr:carboxylesterase family protein [Anaerolineales bacterium]MCX7609816.1 carboxylesterase family protein [Anaerolineales bacterium]
MHKNIAFYGGNPNRIALLGHSAGADIISNVTADPAYVSEYSLDLSVLTCAARSTPRASASLQPPRRLDGEQGQWKRALGNTPNDLTETSATPLFDPALASCPY